MSEKNNDFDLDELVNNALGNLENRTAEALNKSDISGGQPSESAPTDMESPKPESTVDATNNNPESTQEKYKNYNFDGVQTVDNGEKPVSRGYSLSDIRSARAVNDDDDEVEYVRDRKGRRKEKKQHGILKAVILTIVIIAVSLCIAGAGLVAMIDIMGFNFKNNEKEWVTIPEGASTEQISELLYEREIIQYPFLFRVYSKLAGADGTYNYGDYELQAAMGYDGIISALQEAGIQAPEVEVTIPEGATIDQIRSLLVTKNVCSESEFNKATGEGNFSYDFIAKIPADKVYYKLEGYLSPETYHFFEKTEDADGVKNAERAIDKMLSQTDKIITDDMKKSAEQRGYTVHEMLTLASILELEASGYPAEMPKVAQVFYNRLDGKGDAGKYLGSTPTADYPYGNGRYNTNVEGGYPGLPPGPLCSPSADAIKAAFSPDTSVTATYFVTDKSKKFYYTNSLSEHNTLISKLKAEGNWEY